MNGIKTSDVNKENAYKYSDNWAVCSTGEPRNVIGCEHNLQEASALAKWLTEHHGREYDVVHNRPALVEASKAFRDKPFRFPARDEIFAEMGVGR